MSNVFALESIFDELLCPRSISGRETKILEPYALESQRDDKLSKSARAYRRVPLSPNAFDLINPCFSRFGRYRLCIDKICPPSNAETYSDTRSFICSVRNNRKSVSPELGKKIFAILGKRISEDDLEIFMPLRMQRDVKSRLLDFQVRKFVLQRANGFCELCGSPAPFIAPDGTPYLEIHHIKPLLMGGSNLVSNVVALCPNCNSKIQICPSEEDNQILIDRAASKTT